MMFPTTLPSPRSNALNDFEPLNLLAFLVINAYNGKRGIIRGCMGKHLVYLFYPCHLMLLWIIATIPS